MISSVGDTQIVPLYRAFCHCGAVVPELSLPDGIADARRCNCSPCRRKDAVPLARLRVVRGADPSLLGPVPTGDGLNQPSDRPRVCAT